MSSRVNEPQVSTLTLEVGTISVTGNGLTGISGAIVGCS